MGERTCSADDCGRKHYAGGLCRPHYDPWRRAQSYARSDWPTCQSENCDKPRVAKGLCHTHYQGLLRKQRRCSVGECDRPYARTGYCRGHWLRAEKYGDPLLGPPIRPRAKNGRARPITNAEGYRLIHAPDDPHAQASGYALEHKVVMAAAIGRRLMPGENVHHINGVRDDNRAENLELWVTMQPTGQRPSDLVAFAHEILRRYGQDES